MAMSMAVSWFLKENSYSMIIKKMSKKTFPGDKCKICMPGQISINAIYQKIIEDVKCGIMPKNQYFYSSL